jgi:cell wall-associated NlpC family hydrolase
MTRGLLLAGCALLLAACGGTDGPGASAPSISPAPSSPRSSVVARPSRTSITTPSPSPTPSPRPSPTTIRSPSPSPKPADIAGYVALVPLPPRCLAASPAIVGVKVYLVQKALGLVGHRERYDTTTQQAVRRFQARHGLVVDGVVGPRTWAALPIREPYCVDRYTAQPAVGLGATPGQRIEAMIGYARARLGTPYIWGGAGPMGFDCSGLAIQAMYAGGRTVPGLNTNMHVGADFRSTHYLYASGLVHVRFPDRKRGDLIFYGHPITHMAIYLGGGRIIEDVRPVEREASLYADGLSVQPWVVRPFPAR